MKWLIFYKQKFIRPVWYIDYNKERAREELIKRTGWKYYGGHHLENMASAFTHKVCLPQRFGSDLKNLTLAASARNGSLTREQALEKYKRPIAVDHELVEYVKKRLMLTDR